MLTENKAIIPSELDCSTEVTYSGNIWTLSAELSALANQKIPFSFTYMFNGSRAWMFIFGYVIGSSTLMLLRGINMKSGNLAGNSITSAEFITLRYPIGGNVLHWLSSSTIQLE